MKQWERDEVQAEIVRTGGCVLSMCAHFCCCRWDMFWCIRRLGLYEFLIEQRQIAKKMREITKGIDYETIKTLIVRTRGNIRRMLVLMGRGYSGGSRCQMREYIRRFGLYELVLEQRRLAKQARRNARLAWLKRAEQELCNGSDDSIDGGSLPGDVSGRDSW